MKKIWMRFGGYVSCTPEQENAIINGDTATLVEVIKTHGIELNGNTYEPETEEEFELEPMQMTFFREVE